MNVEISVEELTSLKDRLEIAEWNEYKILKLLNWLTKEPWFNRKNIPHEFLYIFYPEEMSISTRTKKYKVKCKQCGESIIRYKKGTNVRCSACVAENKRMRAFTALDPHV